MRKRRYADIFKNPKKLSKIERVLAKCALSNYLHRIAHLQENRQLCIATSEQDGTRTVPRDEYDFAILVVGVH